MLFGRLTLRSQIRSILCIEMSIEDRKKKESENRLLVENFLVSGLSKSEFARKNGVTYSNLAYFVKKYAPDNVRPQFTEEERRSLIDEFLQGRLTRKEFAESKNFSEVILSIWLSKYDPDHTRRDLRNERMNFKLYGRSVADKEELLDEYLSNDLTSEEFSRMKGIVEGTMLNWLSEYDPSGELRKEKTARMKNLRLEKTRLDRLELLDEYLNSNLNGKEFAKSKGMPYGTMFRYFCECDPGGNLRKAKTIRMKRLRS